MNTFLFLELLAFDIVFCIIWYQLVKLIPYVFMRQEFKMTLYLVFCNAVSSQYGLCSIFFSFSDNYYIFFAGWAYTLVISGFLFWVLRAVWLKLTLRKCKRVFLKKGDIELPIDIDLKTVKFKMSVFALISFIGNLSKTEKSIVFILPNEKKITLQGYTSPNIWNSRDKLISLLSIDLDFFAFSNQSVCFPKNTILPKI